MSFTSYGTRDNSSYTWIAKQDAILKLQKSSEVQQITYLNIESYSLIYYADDTFTVMISITPKKGLKGAALFNTKDIQEHFDNIMTNPCTTIFISLIYTNTDALHLELTGFGNRININITDRLHIGPIMEIFNKILKIYFCKNINEIEYSDQYPNSQRKIQAVCQKEMIQRAQLPPIVL